VSRFVPAGEEKGIAANEGFSAWRGAAWRRAVVFDLVEVGAVTTRVCIADSVTVFRAAVRQVLLREQDFDVIEAANLAELERALASGVDVVLIDEALPPNGAAEAVRSCAGRCNDVIVWTLRPGPAGVLAAIRAGATGYLRKEISPEGLVRSLRAAAKGESPLSRDLAALMINALHEAESRERARSLANVLSLREREVLDHVAKGARNKQIAAALTISEFTVKRHVQNILQKLELPSRRAAAAFYDALAPADDGGGVARAQALQGVAVGVGASE
jgi:two-component system nitrate/nitrite response regulator NarL